MLVSAIFSFPYFIKCCISLCCPVRIQSWLSEDTLHKETSPYPFSLGDWEAGINWAVCYTRGLGRMCARLLRQNQNYLDIKGTY